MKRHLTVEDLWTIPIEHGCSWLPPNSPIPVEDRLRYVPARPIRLFLDNTADLNRASQVDWDKRLEGAYFEYGRRAAAHKDWWKPQLNGRFDKLRWDLHLLLLKWRVII